MSINANGNGTATFHYELEQAVIDFISAFDDIGQSDEEDIFDVNEVKKSFADIDTVKLTEIKSPAPHQLEGTIQFSDIGRVFSINDELNKKGIISFTKNSGNNEKTLQVNLSRDNYRNISIFQELMENPLFEMYGPQYNEDLTEEEYFAMMEYAFGKEGVESLKESSIDLTVNINGSIVRTNGKKESGNRIVFSIPLVRVLLLDKPLNYFLVYR